MLYWNVKKICWEIAPHENVDEYNMEPPRHHIKYLLMESSKEKMLRYIYYFVKVVVVSAQEWNEWNFGPCEIGNTMGSEVSGKAREFSLAHGSCTQKV